MRQQAIAIQLTGWRVLGYVRWARRALTVSLTVVIAALLVQPPVQQASAAPSKADRNLYSQASAHPAQTFSVIVRESQPTSSAAEELVRSLGGHITHELSIVGGFSAVLTGSSLRTLTASPAVWRVWGDGRIHMASSATDRYDRMAANTVWQYMIGLDAVRAYNGGLYNGTGVTVALLDTGVVPVPDLASHITHVVDLTAEHDGMDRYGHGTHMAGIIAGDGTSSNGTWTGVAPRANLVSIKVAGVDGSTDVSIVMAGLQWAVTHKAQYNIKVLNLSFGTDSTQPYSVDPLDYAVEQAWRAGIFVAVSAGNRGLNGSNTISKPGDDPYVFTVGAADLKNTGTKSDDVVADFSSRGPTQDGFSKPDLVAPGTTIVSNRDAGSLVDTLHPDARVGDSYFKGTGTSQATAVVSGVAALVYQANPSLSPDQVKNILVKKAQTYINSQPGAGAGLLNAQGAVAAAQNRENVPPANQGLVPSTGTGSLEASRGTMHVYVMKCATTPGSVDPTTGVVSDPVTTCSPVLLTGEMDALGNAWSGNAWSGNAWSGNAWSGNAWSGVAWEGNAWSGNAWSGNAWSGNAWSGTSWSGNAWSGNAWSGNAWSGNAWSGNAWSGNAWSGNAWSGNAWSGTSWSGNAWSDGAWA